MKKVLSIVAASAMLAIVACGPSAEEKQKAAEQAMQDSIARADSAQQALQSLENADVTADTTVVADTTNAPAPAAQ